MKTRIFCSIPVLMAYFLLLGCKKDGPGKDGPGNANGEVSITIPEKSVAVSYWRGYETISVASEGASWTAIEQPDVDWITDLTKMGNESLQVIYKTNTSSQTRTATLEIKAGNKIESIIFSQKTIPGTLAGEYLMAWRLTMTGTGGKTLNYSGTGAPLTVTEENRSCTFEYSLYIESSSPYTDTWTYTVNQIQQLQGSINNYQLEDEVQLSHTEDDLPVMFQNATITNIDDVKHTLGGTVYSDAGPIIIEIVITSATQQ